MNNSVPSIATAIVLASALMAQEPPPRQPTTPTPPATKQPEGTHHSNRTAPAQETNSDAILITCIALQRAQNPEVERPTLDEGLQAVPMHLEHVKSLIKQTEVASLQGRK